ncbi:Prominin family-containing protein [Strongyloides ratti]|uniref:Prominin family-containing protein n=1 Tax=Strongyloides ratti TaxID=34506 RepID=A0A090KS68_STRRB|nr:Prominin family-containing protein [Strongyloides ratti]CEF60226.1 Prominin family-containing protein [Strongyloides ratti]
MSLLEKRSHFILPIFLLYIFLFDLSYCIEFTTTIDQEKYSCSSFIDNTFEDKALRSFYNILNDIILQVSKPFPHQDLLNNDELDNMGNGVVHSIQYKSTKWFQYIQGWLIIAFIFLFITFSFPILWIIYRICSYCSMTKNESQESLDYSCFRKYFLNFILIIIVVIKLIICGSIFMSLIYAEYGGDKLPDRIGTCFNDLSLYKRNTDAAFRNLLIENFKELNASMVSSISRGGNDIIENVKKNTGNNILDTIRNKTEIVKRLVKDFENLYNSTEEAAKGVKRLKNEWEKFKNLSRKELIECIDKNQMPESGVCRMFKDHLETLPNPIEEIPKNVMLKDLINLLKDYEKVNLIEHLNRIEAPFNELEDKVQLILNTHKHIVFNKLKIAGDYLFTLSERITAQLRLLDFNKYSTQIIHHFGPDSYYPIILKWIWIGGLIIGFIYAINSLCYMLAILYGIFGKKTDFYETDCCSKSTGGKYMNCGIWTSIITMTILSIITVLLMITTTNTSNLVCLPYKNPFQRNDILSMLERIIQRTNHTGITNGEFAILREGRMPSDIIRACGRNETFYKMFGLDNTYHFLDLSSYRQEFVNVEKELEQYIHKMTGQYDFKEYLDDQFKTALSMIPNLNDINKWQDSLNTESLKETLERMDLTTYIKDLNLFLSNNPIPSPNIDAIKSLMGNLELLEKENASPLRNDISNIIKNMEKFSLDLSQLNINFQDLRDRLIMAQSTIVKGLRSEISSSTKDIINKWKNDVEEYLSYIKKKMNEDVTTCKPIADITRGIFASVCNQIVDPLNGIWAAMMLYIFLSIPMIIIGNYVIKEYKNTLSYNNWRKNNRLFSPAYQSPIGNTFATDAFEIRNKDVNPYGVPAEIFNNPSTIKPYGIYRS